MSKIKVIGYLNPSYSRIIRFEQIAKYLNKTGDFTCVVSPNGVNDEELAWADVIFSQSTIDPHMIGDMWAYKQERGKVLIVDRDDAFQVLDDSPFKEKHKKNNVVPWSKELVKIASAVTVTNRFLKNTMKELNPEVHILPNYLDMELWDRPLKKNTSDIIRIGWAGSITHLNDLKLALPAIKRILNEYKNTKFVVCGDPTILREFKEFSKNRVYSIAGTADYYRWPMLAHTLMYDIGIAPLVENDFNKSRSNLKFLEYGMMGAAGIYSPTAYKETVTHGFHGIIASTEEEWYIGLKRLVESQVTREYLAKNANNYVRNYCSIEQHANKWGKLYEKLLGL